MFNRTKLSPQLILAGIIGALAIFVILIAIVSFLSPSSPKKSPPPVTTSSTPLDKEEKSYPQATPQPFRHKEESDTGTLIVTSNVEDVKVFLDTSSHAGDPEEPIPPGQKWPSNLTPFTVEKIPVGEHTLEAIKAPEYDMTRMSYVIKKDQITRVHITLIPLRTSN